METNFSISISNPCSEQFKTFQKTETGGFCNSSKKEVTYFRYMADEQVLQVLENSKKQTCGHFKKEQLNRKIEAMKTQQVSALKFIRVAAIAVFWMLTFQSVQAQDKNAKTVMVKNVKTSKVQDKFLIGTVNDESGPLAGASILLKGTKVGVTADFDGKFTFPKVLQEGDVILVSYIGYETQKFVIKKDQTFLKVQLSGDNIDLLGAVETNKVYSSKRK